MSTRFVNVDGRTPRLLPPDLRDWIREEDMVHFVISAVRYLTADTHPDHDTICKFRRENLPAVQIGPVS